VEAHLSWQYSWIARLIGLFANKMDLIFTDLDGTLLDRDTYSWEAARPALDRLLRDGIPWILVTSRTRAEVEFWRERLRNEHPFIVENGGAAFVPPGYFRRTILPGRRSGLYEVLNWGATYAELVSDLQKASDASRCRVRGFHEMSPEEVASLCGLPLSQAVLAKQREHDEPFLILDPNRADALMAAIEAMGRNCLQGGRLWHITGRNDKAAAVEFLSELYSREYSAVRSIGLGDGLNDVPFLKVVTRPVIIPSPQVAELRVRVPTAIVSDRPGPAGWNDVILKMIGGGSTAV
jgi:mannosyl-3-phosphoglycerate phosphatase